MKELSGNKIVKIMRLRLNMINVRMNYKRTWEGNVKCPLCTKEEGKKINFITLQEAPYGYDSNEPFTTPRSCF